MKFRKSHILLLLLVLTMTGQVVFGQADVVENESNVLYVNGQTGSDMSPGSAVSPLKTITAAITKALAANRLDKGTKVLVAPGTYHEDLQINEYGKTPAPLTIEAVTPGSVIIDGADVVTGWAQSGDTYSARWTDSVGRCALPSGWSTNLPPIVRDNEMLFVNGVAYTQVTNPAPIYPGTFYVESAHDEIKMSPLPGTNMATATVEVSNRRQVLHVDSSKNVVIRGLAFEHAASCLNTEAVEVASSSNVLFDSDVTLWNDFGGIGVSGSSNVTVQETIASYNGGVGINTVRSTNIALTGDETAYNNWRSEQGAFYDFAMGGVKVFSTHGSTITGLKSYNNGGEGLWFDTDNENATVSNSQLIGNLVANLKLEANEGPFTVQGNSMCSGGTGVLLIDTAGVTLRDNYLYDNGSPNGNFLYDQNAQVYLAGKPGGRSFTNFQTNAPHTVENINDTFEGNTIVDGGRAQYLFSTYLTGRDWSDFQDSFRSSNNTWFDATNAEAFRVSGGKQVNLAGWESLTGQGSDSVWASTSRPASCAVPPPSYVDFALLGRNAINFIPSYTMVKGTVAIPLQVLSYGDSSVELSVSGLPHGVTASFSPSSLTSGASTLSLKASSAAAKQTASITVFGKSSHRTHTLTFSVNIVPAP